MGEVRASGNRNIPDNSTSIIQLFVCLATGVKDLFSAIGHCNRAF